MTKRHKVCGILGGMGPVASYNFLRHIRRFTKAEKDSDHIRIVMDDNIWIPSRTRAVLFGEESPVRGMVESCKKLQSYPVDFLAIPCNSAQAWREEVQSYLDVEIVDIFEVAIESILKKYPDHKKLCVLGGYVTHKMRTYYPYAQKHGIEYVEIPEPIQEQIQKIIELVKLQEMETANQITNKILRELYDKYHAVMLLGCTEFGCMALDQLSTKNSEIVPVVDSSIEYAKSIVRKGGGVIDE